MCGCGLSCQDDKQTVVCLGHSAPLASGWSETGSNLFTTGEAQMKKPIKEHNQFESLFLQIRPRLVGLVSRYLKRSQDVEDVIQETFVRSYQSWIKQRIEQPEHYLFRTARNLSLK